MKLLIIEYNYSLEENKWIEVVVDDQLAIDCLGGLIGFQSKDENEFWVPLLE